MHPNFGCFLRKVLAFKKNNQVFFRTFGRMKKLNTSRNFLKENIRNSDTNTVYNCKTLIYYLWPNDFNS